MLHTQHTTHTQPIETSTVASMLHNRRNSSWLALYTRIKGRFIISSFSRDTDSLCDSPPTPPSITRAQQLTLNVSDSATQLPQLILTPVHHYDTKLKQLQLKNRILVIDDEEEAEEQKQQSESQSSDDECDAKSLGHFEHLKRLQQFAEDDDDEIPDALLYSTSPDLNPSHSRSKTKSRSQQSTIRSILRPYDSDDEQFGVQSPNQLVEDTGHMTDNQSSGPTHLEQQASEQQQQYNSVNEVDAVCSELPSLVGQLQRALSFVA